MTDIPSPIEVQTWPQAAVMIVLIVAILVVPSVIGYLNNRQAKATNRQVAQVKQQVTNNGGSSMKDAVDRIETVLTEHMEWSERYVQEVASGMEAIRSRLDGLEAVPVSGNDETPD